MIMSCSQATILTAEDIIKQAETGDFVAESTMQVIEDRIARGLAMFIGLLDPDMIVIGSMLAKSKRLFFKYPTENSKTIFAPQSIEIYLFLCAIHILIPITYNFMALLICAITVNNTLLL